MPYRDTNPEAYEIALHGQEACLATGRHGAYRQPCCLAAALEAHEQHLREQIATEIEADTIPANLLACDHDDQLTAIRRWDAFVARGTCQDCDGTGVDKYDDEPCSTCGGRGTWGGASDAQ